MVLVIPLAFKEALRHRSLRICFNWPNWGCHDKVCSWRSLTELGNPSWITLVMLIRKDQHREKCQERVPEGHGPHCGLLIVKSNEEGAQETAVQVCRG